MNDQSELSAATETPVIQHPPEVKTIYLGGLFFLALLAAINVASPIVLPIVLAFILKLVLYPLLRFLRKIQIPQTLAAIIILALLASGIVGLGTALAGPAAIWVEKLPNGISKLQQQLNFLEHPIAMAKKFMVRAESLTKGSGPAVMPVAIVGTGMSDRVITATRAFATQLFTTMLVLFYLLISGDTFLRRLVEVLPRFKDKRQAVDISQQIEEHISSYLIAITLINAIVGLATGFAMRACGIEDSLLWGTMAFLLNYIPLMGPLIGAVIFLLAGMLNATVEGAAFFPAIVYLLIHFTESMFITPLFLAKRFTLNPVLVILSLVFWYWMWGVPGAILAMPMLAIMKIICDRIEQLKAFGHFIEG